MAIVAVTIVRPSTLLRAGGTLPQTSHDHLEKVSTILHRGTSLFTLLALNPVHEPVAKDCE
ncbi:hypothetical protein [Actinomadura sp. WMMB 499]|uniref:hypothetical protein n=1 Tax=Actinomadura sp. WMMB 499 TaxID=1219491 RepID=UPI001244E270|nr:hypothetical protein [Actinomadura sp. WMMB 499]QFG21112.1 hypothetical protein F7P10_08135 [Actinomadura sp. WMMB 499]